MQNQASSARRFTPGRVVAERVPKCPGGLRTLLLIVGLLAGFGLGAAQAQGSNAQSAGAHAASAAAPGAPTPGATGAARASHPVSFVPNAALPGTAALQDLVDVLQDPARRQKLVEQIEALIAVRQGAAHLPAAQGPAAQPASASANAASSTSSAASGVSSGAKAGADEGFIGLLSGGASYIGATVAATAADASFGDVDTWVRGVAADPALRLSVAKGAILIVLVLAIALAARQAALLGVKRLRLFRTGRGPIWVRLFKTGGLVLLGWLPLLVFLAVGYAVLSIGASLPGCPPLARALALDLMLAIALVRAIGVLAGAVLQPASDTTRLIHVDEETATYWIVWISRLSRLLVYVGFATEFARQAGMPQSRYEGVLKLLGLVFVGLVAMLILQNRTQVARLIRGQGTGLRTLGQVRAQIGEIWHILAILYILGVYGVWAAGIPGGFGFLVRASVLTVVILVAARFLVVAGTALLHRFLAVPTGLAEQVPGLQARVNLYAPVVIASGRILVSLIALLSVLQAWGLGALGLLATPLGQRLVGGTAATAVTAVIAVAVWEAVSLAMEFYIARPTLGAAAPDADAAILARGARVRTVLPLFRKAMAIVLGIVVGLIGLSEFGVNIAPLLAGAGIVGIAVGFGAQSLVKDVITGIFVLLQDAVSVGDVVDVGNGNSGFVEQITIRSIRLRDQSGTVIIVPFSEVGTVKNMTKDFAFALFDIGVAYREDVDNVIEVVTALSEELRQDADFAWRITAPIEILGLDRFADSAVMIKVRIKTRPIQQWNVMREFNRRMKRRFDELGIEMPFPHQTIYFGVDRAGQAPPAHLAIERASERHA